MIAFFRTLKFRLTLWYACILTVFLTIFAFLMYSELAKALYRDADKNLLNKAVALERSLLDFIEPPEEVLHGRRMRLEGGAAKLLEPEFRDLLVDMIKKWENAESHLRRSTLMVRLLSFDHAVMISNLKGWEKEVIFPDFERDSAFMERGRSLQTIYFRKQPIRLYYHLVRFSGRPAFVVQTGFPLFEVEKTLSRLLFIFIIWIPAAVAAAGIAGWFLAKGSLAPIDGMIREARQITAAYLKGRLPRTNTGDELDRLAATLNEMMDRLAASTRAVQEFSSNVSHELKTPLAIIRGEAELALRRARSPEALLETLRIIEEEVNGLIRLVDDLMLLVRSDSKQLRFEKKIISLPEVLGYVAQRFQERAQGKGIDLRFSFEEELEVFGDEVYLKRLFSNLVDNAIKFTGENGKVSIELERRENRAVVKITDTGMGIEPEIQERVFSRFYRTDQARTQEGAGLGLNIAKAICDAHQALLTLQSTPQKGTTVTVEMTVASPL